MDSLILTQMDWMCVEEADAGMGRVVTTEWRRRHNASDLNGRARRGLPALPFPFRMKYPGWAFGLELKT